MRCRLAFFALLLAVTSLKAEVTEIKILHREPFADGKAFGDTGPYERIVGIVKFAIDPKNKRNTQIVDLDKAPVNKDGKVEFQSDLFILAPKDPSKGNGAILYDVNNRGKKLALAFFNEGATSYDPKSEAEAGNGFLMRHGFTLVWCGWIGELLPLNHSLMLQAPIATDNGKPITGIVRFEFVGDTKSETLPLSRREGHGSYNPTAKGEKEGTLTYRARETDERQPISRDQWSLERQPLIEVKEGVPGTLAQIRCRLKGGFKPGYIYELVCECENPIVQGVGLAAVRDLVSFIKYDGTDKNPLAVKGKSAINRALGFGISQSGRFLRHLVYEGFNADEKDRKAFDGLMPHVAGGGLGFFNHRFAQATRHNGEHEEHLYPSDVFPFTYGDEKQSYLTQDEKVASDGRIDGVIHRYVDPAEAKFLPVIMHTQSSSEYWNRSGSLVHTDPIGTRDEVVPDSVRIYTFGGTQHGPSAFPPKAGNMMNLPNPGNFKPICRALLIALDDWAKNGTKPPASAYPTFKDKTLVDWRQEGTLFPAIPKVEYPKVIQQPPYGDFGPDFFKTKIITQEPPIIKGHYRVLAAKTDADGNDLGTLLPPEVAVPLATYTPWNLRKKEIGAEGALYSLTGSYIPFPKTAAERKASGDPRKSIEERFSSFENYLKQYRAVCDRYVKERYLLAEDIERLLAFQEKVRDKFPDEKRGKLPEGK